MAIRVAQNAAELLADGKPNLRVGQVAGELLADDNPHARVSQVTGEILAHGNPGLRASQLTMEILWLPAPPALVTQIAGAILVDDDPHLRAGQTCAQILYDWQPPPYPEFTMSNVQFPAMPGLRWNVTRTPQFNTTVSRHTSGREARVSNFAHPLWKWEMEYEFLREGNGYAELETLCGFFLQRQGQFDTFLYADPTESNVRVPNTTVNNGTGAQTVFTISAQPQHVFVNGVEQFAPAWTATSTTLTFASAPANGALIISTDSTIIGLTDGATNQFTLTKTWGGYTEPVGYLDASTLQVYVNGVATLSSDPVNPWSLATPNTLIFNVPPAANKVITAAYTWYYRVRFGEDAQDYDNFLWQLWQLKKLTLEMTKP
jgi:Conserved hypothetical protein 2217 (DUF2460).